MSIDAADEPRITATIEFYPPLSTYFQVLGAIDQANARNRQTLIEHHPITEFSPLADVVVACRCTPETRRDVLGLADHVQQLLLPTSSAAVEPPAAVADRPAPDEEAGAGHLPLTTK